MMTKSREIIGYQMLAQSQVMHYNEMDVPEAKFSYDLSPMAVWARVSQGRFYLAGKGTMHRSSYPAKAAGGTTL